MSGLLTPEHVWAVVAIAAFAGVMVVVARKSAGAWIKVLAVVLVADEVSWWVYLAAGGGEPGQRAQPLPLQLCDVGILIAAAALWFQPPLLIEVNWFWALAGATQAILTPDLPQHFPSYPYFQYYIAHGGSVAAALVLVVGLQRGLRPNAVFVVAALTIAYAAVVGLVDAVTGADYMYLRAKPPSPTPLDFMGPWPWYIGSAALVGALIFAVLDAPFRLGSQRRAEALR